MEGFDPVEAVGGVGDHTHPGRPVAADGNGRVEDLVGQVPRAGQQLLRPAARRPGSDNS